MSGSEIVFGSAVGVLAMMGNANATGSWYASVLASVKTSLAVNDVPVAQAASFSSSEDNSVSGQLTASDDDGTTLSYTLTGQAGNGNAVIYSNGTFTYIPNENWSGTDTYTFSVYDGTVSSNTAIVTIHVQPVNDAPNANDQSITVDAGTTSSGLLTARLVVPE